MKTILLIKFVILIIFSINLKAGDTIQLEVKSDQILKLEKDGSIEQAISESLSMAKNLLIDLKVNEIVATASSINYDITNEIITGSGSQSGSAQSGLFAFSGSYTRTWETTEMVKGNPEEVADFQNKVDRDYRSLQSQLKDYVLSNEIPLTYLKLFVAKALQLAVKLDYNSMTRVSYEIKAVAREAQRITFKGTQSIIMCETTNYAQRSNSSEAGFNSFIFSFSESSKWERPAYSKTTCQAKPSQSATINEVEMLSLRLHYAETLIEKYSNSLGLNQVTRAMEPFTPRWGLPY